MLIYDSGVISKHLQCAAWLVGAVIVAVVPVHFPLPHLSARLVLLAAAAVAVIVVGLQRRSFPMLLVTLSTLLFGAAVRRLVPVNERHCSLGVIQGLEVFAVLTVVNVALWHHLQVGSDTVVAGTCVIAEVDYAAFVGALIRRFDPGEAELVRDVASYDFHNLAKLDLIKRENRVR